MPARYEFPAITRGDTKTLGIFLLRRDVLTSQTAPFEFEGADVEWTISPPGAPEIVNNRTTGLILDVETGRVDNTLTAAVTQAMPAGPVPTRVRYVRGAERTTVLIGNIHFED